jgi:hypothetical protein
MRLKLTRRHELKLKTSTRLPAQFVGGTGMTVTRANGVYTIDMDVDEVVDVLEPTVLDRANHTGTQIASTISDFSEAVDDRVDALVAVGTGISKSYNDGLGTLTFANTGVLTIAGNAGAFTLANGIDNSTNQIQLTAARRTLPTTQVFTSGSGTYTTPANCLWIEVEMVGGGGGGAGSGTTPGAAGDGGDTTFSTLTAAKGVKATGATAGTGGAASGGYLNLAGASGGAGSGATLSPGGMGGASPFGGAGHFGQVGAGPGGTARANSGSGGGGGGVNATVNGGGGGGAGGYVRAIINTPAGSYSYAVGAAGTAGTAGTSGAAGGAGAAGIIIVTEHYGS